MQQVNIMMTYAFSTNYLAHCFQLLIIFLNNRLLFNTTKERLKIKPVLIGQSKSLLLIPLITLQCTTSLRYEQLLSLQTTTKSAISAYRVACTSIKTDSHNRSPLLR